MNENSGDTIDDCENNTNWGNSANRQMFLEKCLQYYASAEENFIPAEKALSPELVAMKMFEPPLMAVAAADDARFFDLKRDEVVGEHLLLPREWLPQAKSVIAFFFPFTAAIRDSNKADMRYPSKAWLNSRIEGQAFINQFTARIVQYLIEQGFASVAPSLDQRFITQTGVDHHGIGKLYTSNWSERHAAYVCGLGSFGLSKGLITEQGMAGRITSVISDLPLTPDGKRFSCYDENCVMCGKCIENCPVGAISFEHGKDHQACSRFLDEVKAEQAPWYGCGKCQVNVPCEFCNPLNAK